jgi:nucleoside-diphosphate-sugar epimerase
MRVQVPSVVARAFTVFGLGERPGRLVPTLLAARAARERVPLSSGQQRRDFVYVEDAARALVELAEQDGATLRSGRYPFDAPCLNLASGALTPVREFVLAFAEVFGIARERLGFGDLPPLLAEMHHPPVPNDRLRDALGWSPAPDPRAGLARMAARLAEGLA